MTSRAGDGADYDVAIIGGGPAGLSAGVWLGRYLRRVVLVDAGDPRNWETRGINGFLGHRSVTPAELRGRGRDDCRRFGVHLVDAEVERVIRDGEEAFRLQLHGGRQLTAPRLLLAFGLRDVWPDIRGLERCYGETVHVCPDCDGYEARDKRTLVIGTGRKAVGMALALLTWTREIVICTNGDPADMDEELCSRLDTLGIPVIEASIRGMHSSQGEVQTAELGNGMQLDCERVFFSIGQFPADDLGTQLGCARDHHGQIEIDHRGATSVQHVYAAGDITPGPQLATVAAASGTVAALSIHRSLLPELQKVD
ncbi:MAG TPA: NAD(P)/FAD-dependent oxidoreductase [Gemmatimonadaceae bacterium]|nr:NAD(P)/FAD-dependent oxidoreductase [Gemmatimonadaceae bacterium]